VATAGLRPRREDRRGGNPLAFEGRRGHARRVDEQEEEHDRWGGGVRAAGVGA
jgi:hypothetical protein